MDKNQFHEEALDLLMRARKELNSEEIIKKMEEALEDLDIKKKFVLSREELLNLLSKRLTQIVVLCNHLMGGVEPDTDYVTEKLNTYPVLDFSNQDVLDRILGILEPRYGVELQKRSWG